MSDQATERLMKFSCGFMRDYSYACTSIEILSGQDFEEYYKGFWTIFSGFIDDVLPDDALQKKLNDIYTLVHRLVLSMIPNHVTDVEKKNLSKEPKSGDECFEIVNTLYKVKAREN